MAEKIPSVHEGHRERLRKRYRQTGLDHFNDHEILEILLGYTILQKDTNPIAHRLIDHFGDLRGVLSATEEDLSQIEGIGPGTAFFLSLLPDVARRYFEQGTQGGKLRLLEMDQIKNFFLPHFVGRRTECVYAVFLSENRTVLDHCAMQEGALSAVSLHVPKLMKEARRTSCRYVIIAHNHFTDTVPSLEDMSATRHIAANLRDLGVGLLDHIIICGSVAASMRETGHLRKVVPPEDQ
jgi:DNA repair protein RadC